MTMAFELDEMGIAQLSEAQRAGRFTSRALVEQYLARIREIDPRVHSVIETNPDAPAIADALDRERKSKGPRGPLHGIPILIKDNIDTADRMKTSAGSLALHDSRPARDAFVAERLRAAGALLLGKTNLSEWANFRSLHSVSGWSGRGGQTRNPYALDRNPSGSSSGSGVAVAANLCAAAAGTETDGSVISPSTMNGIVGLKPTLGLVSRSGIIPIAASQDTAGPMARTVRDVAILLGAMAGVDPRDAATRHAQVQSDYTRFLVPNGLRGVRLGVARKFFGASTGGDRIADDAIALMTKLGAVIADPADLPSHGRQKETEFDVLLYEFKAGLNAYLSGPGERTVRSLADVIAFNEKNAARELQAFDQSILIKAEQKGPLTEKAYLDALEAGRRYTRKEGIDAALSANRLDAIVCPTSPPAWLTDPVNGDPDIMDCCGPAAVAGYPHITVPAGFVHGLPVGISFFGAAWSEPMLLQIAYAFEQASKARRPPRFAATAA